MAYSAQARTNMITNQLRPAGVNNTKLLEAVASVSREDFLPDALQGVAYLDEDIPLGHDRFLMEPRVFSLLLDAADIKPTDKVLDVACATGYSTAVLSLLAKSVTAVESVGEFAEIARRNLRKLKHDVQLFCASLSGGYSLKAPYDVIFINGGIEEEPTELFGQLAKNGKIIAIQLDSQKKLQGRSGVGKAICWTKIGKNIHSQTLFEAAVPLLPDFQSKAEFKF